MSAGASIPPAAATMGSAALRAVESSPTSTSRLISSPMTKKKTAISASSIHMCREAVRVNEPTTSPTGIRSTCSYAGPRGELATTIASAAAASRTAPRDHSSDSKAFQAPSTRSTGRVMGDGAGPADRSDTRHLRLVARRIPATGYPDGMTLAARPSVASGGRSAATSAGVRAPAVVAARRRATADPRVDDGGGAAHTRVDGDGAPRAVEFARAALHARVEVQDARDAVLDREDAVRAHGRADAATRALGLVERQRGDAGEVAIALHVRRRLSRSMRMRPTTRPV